MAGLSIREEKIRKPIVDGLFYPSNAERLKHTITALLSGTAVPPGDASAIICPHAAYSYAGTHIASAFKSAMAREVEKVIILAPLHRDEGETLVLPESSHFRTPLGLLPVDQILADELCSMEPQLEKSDAVHTEEHCIEVQLPFIQHLFPGASILPLLMGRRIPDTVRLAVETLRRGFEMKRETTLVVVTTNLSSQRNRTEPETLLGLIEEQDWEAILDGVGKGDIDSCGAHCVAALLCLFHGSPTVRVLTRSDTESDIEGAEESDGIEYAAVSISEEGSG